MKKHSMCFIAVFGLVSQVALAHGGGLDAYGCHNDRKHGGYHCHRGTLAGQSFASKAEMLEKLKNTTPPKDATKDAPKK